MLDLQKMGGSVAPHFCPVHAHSVSSLLNEFKWCHFTFDLLFLLLFNLSPTTPSCLPPCITQVAKAKRKGAGKPKKSNSDPSSSPRSPAAVDNHIISLLFPLCSFHKILSVCTSSTVVLSCVCVHFMDDRIPGSKGTLEKSTDGV